MRLQLNFKSGKPVYLQVVDQVKAAAASGAVQPGDPLPSIRPLAEELRVNRNTVAKAYAELESQGVIETIAGKGCFVRANHSPLQEGRPAEAPRRGDRRGRRPGASPAGRARPSSSGSPRSGSTRFTHKRARAPQVVRPMTADTPVIEIDDLVRRYGRTDAVNGLSLRVAAGPLLRLLRPQRRRQDDDDQVPAEPAAADERHGARSSAWIRRRHEVAVKSRLAYVPDHVAFYPWMTVRETLDYFASFRARWNRDTERALLDQFRLDLGQKTSHLSKGQRTQLALITAICPEPELLVLDEPTSGLDPIVRREFIQTVIGAYQEGEPGQAHGLRLDAPHLGVRGADRRVHDHRSAAATCSRSTPTPRASAIRRSTRASPARRRALDLGGARVLRQQSRELEVLVNGNAADVIERLTARSPETIETEALTLEEIFVTTLAEGGAAS